MSVESTYVRACDFTKLVGIGTRITLRVKNEQRKTINEKENMIIRS